MWPLRYGHRELFFREASLVVREALRSVLLLLALHEIRFTFHDAHCAVRADHVYQEQR